MPFFKRAQLAAADLHLQGIAPAADVAALTLFADNLVPHVLRIDGVLEFEPELAARIERGELIEHDSPEEVEIRACALHAVELLVAAHEGDDARPRSTTRSGTAAASRATRPGRAIGRGRPPTDGCCGGAIEARAGRPRRLGSHFFRTLI